MTFLIFLGLISNLVLGEGKYVEDNVLDSLENQIRRTDRWIEQEKLFRYQLNYLSQKDSIYAHRRDSLLRSNPDVRKNHLPSSSATPFGSTLVLLLAGMVILGILLQRLRLKKRGQEVMVGKTEQKSVTYLEKEVEKQLQLDIESFRNRLKKESSFQDEYWTEFIRFFSLVYPEFIPSLRSEFPELSHYELKICVLIKLNLTQQDIREILNISIESVRKARYRLYKKMGLSSDQELVVFLLTK